MEKKKKVLALVAHDNMKRDLAEWVDWNSGKLSEHHLVCTGTTGKMVVPTAINRSSADFLISSPLFEDDDYCPVVKDYREYVERVLK